MCKKAVEKDPSMLKYVPDHFNTQEICDKAVIDDPSFLQYVPDWFVTREEIQMWYDKSEYCDKLFQWYEGYEKRKAQKTSIKKELLSIGIHQDIGIGVFLRMRKKRQKIMDINMGLFCVWWPDIKKFFGLNKIKKDEPFSLAFSCRIIQV